jgi:hypothetical protein
MTFAIDFKLENAKERFFTFHELVNHIEAVNPIGLILLFIATISMFLSFILGLCGVMGWSWRNTIGGASLVSLIGMGCSIGITVGTVILYQFTSTSIMEYIRMINNVLPSDHHLLVHRGFGFGIIWLSAASIFGIIASILFTRAASRHSRHPHHHRHRHYHEKRTVIDPRPTYPPQRFGSELDYSTGPSHHLPPPTGPSNYRPHPGHYTLHHNGNTPYTTHHYPSYTERQADIAAPPHAMFDRSYSSDGRPYPNVERPYAPHFEQGYYSRQLDAPVPPDSDEKRWSIFSSSSSSSNKSIFGRKGRREKTGH